MANRPTLRAVAQAAGVSTASVSYAFNRPDRLSAASRGRILAVARELGYAGPDARGRSLRTGQAGAIGVVLAVELTYALTDPYVLELMGGLAEELERGRTSLMIIPFPPALDRLSEDLLRASTDAVHRAVIDGAVTDGLPPDHPAVRILADRGIPMVHSTAPVAGRDPRADRSVVIDERAAAAALGAHLAALGHRDVAAVVSCDRRPGRLIMQPGPDDMYPYSWLRLQGLRDALGPAARVTVVSGGRNATGSGRVATESLLSRPRPPTAIVADSDVLALAALAELHRRGLRPGADVSVTGFDDVPPAAAAGLTTVRQPTREKGRLMGRMLLDPGFTETRLTLPTTLVVRTSTGPARDPGLTGVDRNRKMP